MEDAVFDVLSGRASLPARTLQQRLYLQPLSGSQPASAVRTAGVPSLQGS
jgi:hypothetical protein